MYKVLKRIDGKLIGPFQRTEYIPNTEYVCTDFDEDPSRDCSRGFYATEIDGVVYSFRNLPEYEVWEVEIGGKAVEIDQFKRRYERMTLLRHVPNGELKDLALAVEPQVGYKLSEALFPVNPLKIQAGEVTEKEIELVKQWAAVRCSVRHSVENSIENSVGYSVRNSVQNGVWNSVRYNVGDSVGSSVWDSMGSSVGYSVGYSVRYSVEDNVWAYMSSLFPNIPKWKNIDHLEGVNPFQPCIDLWHAGFVPSFDGKTWRLHAGRKAEIVWSSE